MTFKEQATHEMTELVSKIKVEHKAQGHRDTGKFENSVELLTKEEEDGIEFVLKYLYYGEYLENGVSSEQIKFPFARARIAALTAWAKRKGMNKPKSAAFGIATKHKKERMPTSSSIRFSSNGRRRFFQSYTIEQNKKMLEEAFGKAALEEMETITDNIIKEYS